MTATTPATSRNQLGVLATRSEWLPVLESLPDATELNGKLPAFFFAHGHPTLLWPKDVPNPRSDLFGEISKPNGYLCDFLYDFGKILLKKYKPKGIVVFSAHWETGRERIVSDWGEENPLLYDYYGFPQALYDITWRSKGSWQLSQRVVEELRKNGMPARTTGPMEARGRDGRTTNKPRVANGLDHGVFIPFKIMFPDTDGPFDVPVVEVSITNDLSPESEYQIGKAVKGLRDEGILIIAGGLTVHSFEDFSSFNEKTAKPAYHEWNDKVVAAVQKKGSVEERKEALFSLTREPEFRLAHPREEHFVPLYVAQGAGEGGEQKLLSGLYGATTVAFGL